MQAPLLPAIPGYDNPQLIAHGTTALVFRAVQTTLNRAVAIKVITAETGSIPVNAARELATTVALSSQPHIVSIIDTGVTEDDRPFIVMEYCEDGSYAQILRQGGPLPVDDVIEVGIKIGEALHAAHEAGIVHRDVKPSNLLRSRFGPALTDFGIARAPDELGGTLTREMMTPHHASPEALLHQAQSGISDVYSLASTMWTLLVGHPPFVDPGAPPLDMYAFRDRVLHEPLPAMPRDDVPRWLVGELTRAMSKLPAQRHTTALEFAEVLRRGTLGHAPSPAVRPALATPVPATARAQVSVPGVPARAWPAALSAPDAPPVGMPPLGTPPLGMPPPSAELGTAIVNPPPAPAEPPPPPPPKPPPMPTALESADEGGWLGPDLAEERPAPTRTLPERDLMHPESRQRNGVVVVLVAVAVLAVAAASALVLTAGDRGRTAGSPNATPTRIITTEVGGAPRDVRVVSDRGSSVTITWTDPTRATASFLVVGNGPAGEKLETKPVPRGTTAVTFTGLNPARNYCFIVGAVYAVDRVATADRVCTHRP